MSNPCHKHSYDLSAACMWAPNTDFFGVRSYTAAFRGLTLTVVFRIIGVRSYTAAFRGLTLDKM